MVRDRARRGHPAQARQTQGPPAIINNYGGLAAGSAALEGSGFNTTSGVTFNRFTNLTLAQFIANPKLAGFNPNLLLPANVFEPANPGYFRQVQGIRSTGLEVNLNFRLSGRWLAFGSYTYVDAREVRTSLSQPRQAKDSFTVFNRYTFDSGALKGAFASLGTIYVGPRHSDRGAYPRPPIRAQTGLYCRATAGALT